MAKYLFKSSLSPEGVAGVLKEGGVARRATVSKALQSVGGSLEAFYYKRSGPRMCTRSPTCPTTRRPRLWRWRLPRRVGSRSRPSS